MHNERKTFSFDFKAPSDGGSFEGYANVFHNVDSAQEIVVPGAFVETLPQFLSDGFICWQHMWEMPIGKPLDAKEDTTGLYIRSSISDTQSGRDCRTLLKDGVIKKMSIGYRVKMDEYLETSDEVLAYWKKWEYKPSSQDIARSQYGVRLLHKISPLFECSLVSVAANDQADITRVKQHSADQIQTEREFERFLRDAGFPKDAAVTICVSGFKALRRRDAEDAPIENEPTPEAEAQTEQAAPEVKTEEIPAETSAPAPVLKLASQEEVRSLYAQLLSSKVHALSAR